MGKRGRQRDNKKNDIFHADEGPLNAACPQREPPSHPETSLCHLPFCIVVLSRKNIHFQSWLAIFGLHAQSGAASPDVQTRRVDRIIMHPHYNRKTKQADIALMHLQQPINFTGQYQTEYYTLITNTSSQL